MDEPLSNQGAKVRRRLRGKPRRLQKQVGMTAICVTHQQEEAPALADTVVLMDQAGRAARPGDAEADAQDHHPGHGPRNRHARLRCG